jgi:hypothetical protein
MRSDHPADLHRAVQVTAACARPPGSLARVSALNVLSTSRQYAAPSGDGLARTILNTIFKVPVERRRQLGPWVQSRQYDHDSGVAWEYGALDDGAVPRSTILLCGR